MKIIDKGEKPYLVRTHHCSIPLGEVVKGSLDGVFPVVELLLRIGGGWVRLKDWYYMDASTYPVIWLHSRCSATLEIDEWGREEGEEGKK